MIATLDALSRNAQGLARVRVQIVISPAEFGFVYEPLLALLCLLSFLPSGTINDKAAERTTARSL